MNFALPIQFYNRGRSGTIIKIYLSCISSLFLSIIVISTKEKVLNTYPPLFNTSLVGLVQQAGYFFIS